MNRYTVDRQNYSIFKTGSNPEHPYVHFFWGKFDFRLTFQPLQDERAENNREPTYSLNGKPYRAAELELLHHDQWYRLVGPTAHGLQLEETLWERKGEKLRVEFPKNLAKVSRGFCAEELGMKLLAKQAS